MAQAQATGQSDGGSSSAEVPSSQLRQADDWGWQLIFWKLIMSDQWSGSKLTKILTIL